MFRFENLEIWKLATEYADELYDTANKFPAEEKFALADQLKRAAVSISNNIAEGSGATTIKDFSCFLDISIKSALETVNIVYFAHLRKYISPERKQYFYQKAETLIKKIRAFKKSL